MHDALRSFQNNNDASHFILNVNFNTGPGNPFSVTATTLN